MRDSPAARKKRHEIAQLELLNPKAAILDETDSGLDIDALRIVSEGVNRYSAQGDRAVLLITTTPASCATSSPPSCTCSSMAALLIRVAANWPINLRRRDTKPTSRLPPRHESLPGSPGMNSEHGRRLGGGPR